MRQVDVVRPGMDRETVEVSEDAVLILAQGTGDPEVTTMQALLTVLDTMALGGALDDAAQERCARWLHDRVSRRIDAG